MSWTMTHCHFDLSPEEIEEMEVMLELLKTLQEKPERFLMLFQPRFNHLPWFSEVLFEKICKLVKKEAIKEIGQIEGQLQHDAEQKAGQPPTSPMPGGR